MRLAGRPLICQLLTISLLIGLHLSSLVSALQQFSTPVTPDPRWIFPTSTPPVVSRRSPILRKKLQLVFSMLSRHIIGAISVVLLRQLLESSRGPPLAGEPRIEQREPRHLLQMSFSGLGQKTAKLREPTLSIWKLWLKANILLNHSADATEGGEATGAMSYAFIRALSKNPQQSYQQLLSSIRDELSGKYSQKPQLSCSHPLGNDGQPLDESGMEFKF